MNFKLILTLLSLSFTSTICQTIPKAVLASVIQDILSPKNTEKASQLIHSASGNRKVLFSDVPRAVVMANSNDGISNKVMVQQIPEVAMPGQFIIRKNAEVVTPNRVFVQKTPEVNAPSRLIVQRNGELTMPKNVIIRQPEVNVPRGVILQKRSEVAMPTRVVLQKNPEVAVPSRVILQSSPEAVMPSKVVVQRNAEVPVPRGIILQNSEVVARSMLPDAKQPVIINRPKMVEYVLPQDNYYNTNPFLPAASPVSTVAPPTSSLLPPVLPASRGQFLRKIPIPPPSL